MNVLSLFASLSLDNKGYLRSLDTAERATDAFSANVARRFNSVGEVATRLGRTLTLGVTTPVVGLGAAFIAAASDAEETGSKFRTIFQDIGDIAEATATRFADSFGLSATSAERLLGNTADLLTGFGFAADEALTLSEEVNSLAIDLASFTNFAGGAEGASRALTSALLGETEAAKSLGIVIRQDLIDERIDELRAAGELLDATDQQARAYATMQIATEQSANAVGDYARTNDSFANQMRRLNEQVFELRVAFGEILLPVATRIADATADLVARFADLDEKTRTAILTIAGISAVVGPVLVVLGQAVISVGALITAFSTLGIGIGAFLGPVGIVAALGAAFFVFQGYLNQNAEAVNEQRRFIQDLMGDYAQYRMQLTITSDSERDAARERIQTLRSELEDRLDLLEAAAAQETARVQGWLDNPFIKFLLPGFVTAEAGANQGTLAAIEEVRANLDLLDADLERLEGGARFLESFTTTPMREPSAPAAPGAVPGAPAVPSGGPGEGATRQEVFQAELDRQRGIVDATIQVNDEVRAAAEERVRAVAAEFERDEAARRENLQGIADVNEELVRQEDASKQAQIDSILAVQAQYEADEAARVERLQAIADVNTERARIDQERTQREQAEADARARAVEEEQRRKANALQAAMQYAMNLSGDFQQSLSALTNNLVTMLGNALQGVAITAQDMAQTLASAAVAVAAAFGEMVAGAVTGEVSVGESIARAVLTIVQQMAAMVLATHVTAVVMAGQLWNPWLVAAGVAGITAAAVGLRILNSMGANAGSAPEGSIASMREERADLVRQRDQATTDEERARLNRQIDELDRRIAEAQDAGVPDSEIGSVVGSDSPGLDRITPRDMGASLGAAPQGVQLAVAVPLLDAANAFGSHVNQFGGFIDRLVTEGITVNMGAGSRTAVLR